MLITSVFDAGQSIPVKYTCHGEDLSPPLKFFHLPNGVKSLALVVDDPDAPNGTFDHWIVWNIPANLTQISEGAPEFKTIEPHPSQGVNSYKQNGYRGPCPPPGKPHHYHFKLYALDTTLNIEEGSTKQALEQVMKGHIIDQTELVGVFQSKS
jgi:Raf kinase inhibitor-like YbhB/YbcL family protein